MVTVYSYKIFNVRTDDYVMPPCKRIADEIMALKGVIIPGSAEQVQPTALDWLGRYYPATETPQTAH